MAVIDGAPQMTTTRPVFTVFTPTFNRARTLPRVYDSLCAQTFTNFEWLIVDDGSADDTPTLVQGWIDAGRLAVRYLRQANAGKHVAFNRGVREARGELFVPLDSDDSCVPQALERFHHHWKAIPEDGRSGFSGITCLCRDDRGRIVGGPLPADTLDGRPFEVMSRLRRQGEMWGFHRTSVLSAFPFPEVPGERFVPEGLVWNRIGQRYQIRFINEALRGYHDTADSLSAKMILIRARSPVATVTYYQELMGLRLRLVEKLKAAANAWRFALLGRRAGLAVQTLRCHPVYMAVMCLPGMLLAWRDRKATRNSGLQGQ